MSRNWTSDQEKAINARQGTLLLSAAAGSGKTAVLVERVIRRLTDENRQTSPERLLIVTFTKAAAAEMKQKIISEISSLSAKNPKNKALLRLQMQMQNANISTMDSFCIRLIRENFSSLNISPDFRTVEGGELELMRIDAIEKTIDSLHANQNNELEPLFDMFFRGSSDSLLADSIEMLHASAGSYPFPELWLQEVEDMYTKPVSMENNVWFETIFRDINNTLDYCQDINNEAIEMISSHEAKELGLFDALFENFELINTHISKSKSLIQNRDWDGLIEYAGIIDFYRMNKGKKCNLKDALIEKHTKLKAILKKDLIAKMIATEAEHIEDMEFLKPIISGLIYAVRLFMKNFNETKKEANVLDFSDSLHYALDLLYEKDENGFRLSPFAKELSEQFDEVLIDEYQDTNKAQDMLFKALSKDESNLFMVGDIKQSIYSFRLANPEIFIEQSESLPLYENENYPAKINLSKNFRSKKGILDAINFIFMQIMSRETGNVEYDENEKLYSGRAEIEKDSNKENDTQESQNDTAKGDNAQESQNNNSKNSFAQMDKPSIDTTEIDTTEIDTELHFINYNSNEVYENATIAEAEYLSKLIKNMVNAKTIISVKGEKRPVKYGDFCILLRSAKTNIPIFSEILQKNGIPCQGENNISFFESREVSFLLALLKIIDNPLNDVELLSVMLSPLYGFKEDEIAEMRIKNRSANIYELLINEMQEENKKVVSFLSDLQKYRSLSVIGGISSFIRKLVSETRFMAIISAMQNGEDRKNNVSKLISFGESYDSWGLVGLSGFLRYINRLKNTERENKNFSIKSAPSSPSHKNNVKLMTIHGSKGLEFPIVILARAVQQFNLQDSIKNLLIHPKLGIGVKIQKTEELKRYETIAYKAIQNQIKNDYIAEEMRVLYVALTRACEKLIILSASDRIIKEINDAYSNMAYHGSKLSPYYVLNTNRYSKWLVSACLRHRSAFKAISKNLELDYPTRDSFFIDDESKIKVFLTSVKDEQEKLCDEGSEEINVNTENEEFDEHKNKEEFEAKKAEILEVLNQKMEYEYPYKNLNSIYSKYAASDLHSTSFSAEFSYFNKPRFMQKDEIQGSDIGTATHKFLQYCNFDFASQNIDDEILRLKSISIFTNEEARLINTKQIQEFFKSSLFKRIMNADKIYKEKRFSIFLSATEIDDSLPLEFGDENVLIQGVIDLLFIENGKIVIIDYKTDRIKEESELIKRYQGQLSVYKKAASKVLGLPVSQAIIYSLSLNKEIEV